MTPSDLIARKRKALIDAKLNSLEKKYGAHTEIINVNGIKYQLDLDKNILSIALMHFFEFEAFKLGNKAARSIINSYESFYTIHGNLTKKGNEFMNELLELIAQKTEPIK
ncbi:hypothetical protein ABLA30_17670 [Xenorhabdus nematophila]|uniref:hypothetical protein n=1 Tax=Xenorhabdus nematophila TaxID=628 RepID=UPI0032B75524